LRQEYEKFSELGVEILVIGPEDARAFEKYWSKESLPFTGLPDPNHSVLKLYGQEVKLLKLGRMPAQMLVDKSGYLRFVHYGKSMSDIPDFEEIKSILETDNQ